MAAKLMVVIGDWQYPDTRLVEAAIEREEPDLVLHANHRGLGRAAETATVRRGIAHLGVAYEWTRHDPEWCQCPDPANAHYCPAAGPRFDWNIVNKAKGIEKVGWEVKVHAFVVDGGSTNTITAFHEAGLEPEVHTA